MSTILKKFKRSKNANSIWRQPLAVVGISIIAIWAFLAIFAPWIAPYNPNAQDADKFLTPSAAHWMGTDELGRDIWSRIIHGARISLPYSLLLVILSATLGSIIGAISGYAGGKIDSFIMRVTDVFFAFPGIVLAMAVAAALGPQIRNAVIAVTIVAWPVYARLVRGLILNAKQNDYVTASALLGSSALRTMVVDLRPNLSGPVFVLASLEVGNALLLLSGLSFLGLGAQPPAAEWGSMVSMGAVNFDRWWVGLFPGLAILTAVLAFNFIGDSLRDALDPRTAKGAARLMNLLTVENLTVTLATGSGDAQAVRNLSFNVGHGEILGVAGESGSGKTMTALSMLGLLPYKGKASGSIKFDGREILTSTKREYRDIRGKEIAMIFQDPMTSLHPMLTVEVQLTEHLRHHRKVSKDAARNSALELLATVKIPEPAAALKAHPSQFSGGMRQRIAIAMALACEPKLLIADEPTTALDVTVQAGILKLLHQLRKERNLSVMVITHDLGVLSSLTDRIMIMYAGSEVESGLTSDLLKNPRHPYTKGLIAALPGNSAVNSKNLVSIDGMPPELGNFPTGCAFHTRCKYAKASCKESAPEVMNLTSDHRIFCPVNPFSELSNSGSN